ncbi:MAG: protein kinase, partial [Planctomycetota bacterium]
MDATREHLLGRILLERRVLAEEELRRVVGERDEHIRRGGRITLAQILVRERRIDATAYAALQNEIELRGRACFSCRRAYLVPPGGPAQCPACGGPALLPALPSQAAPPPSSSTNLPLDDYSPSGRFPVSPSGRFAPPGSSPASSAAMRPTNGHNGSSSRGNAFGAQLVPGAPSASSRLMPSMGASPHGSAGHVDSTNPGSHPGHGGAANGSTKQGAELKTLGPYDLLSELGRGGMGVVYKAQHRQTGQTVALKVLLSGEFASPKMLARFKEEAAVVQKLEHPNIVPIFEVGEIDGINYFTMKFVDGDLFQALLKGRGLSARRGAEIVRDVARGAHHAHETGIVHRDLKPANVIVERESGTPFIMDFGLAKDLDDDKALSKTGVAIGTPYYMPPEQAQGKHREIDPRSDVYALGAMLYEVLARKVPFNAESQTLLLRKIVEEDPIPPSQVRQGVPPDLETIALTALKKRKEDRFPSSEAFAKDIERALAGKQIKAKRDPFWTPLVKKLKKNPRVIAIVVVTLVVLAGAVGYGIHFYREKQRLEAEDALRKKQAEEDQKRREAEEAALKRRTEAESLISKGHAKRLQARLSPSFAASRVTLEDAIEAFGNAVPFTDEATEPRVTAL